jgi:hypothetical protein
MSLAYRSQQKLDRRLCVVTCGLRLGVLGMADCDVDNIIDQLLGVRGARPGRQVNLTENEIKWLCTKGREIFQSQPVLLELEAPIKVSSWISF